LFSTQHDCGVSRNHDAQKYYDSGNGSTGPDNERDHHPPDQGFQELQEQQKHNDRLRFLRDGMFVFAVSQHTLSRRIQQEIYRFSHREHYSPDKRMPPK
jgi:hypothetical protein